MADIKTQYMGLELDNPVIVGACKLTANIDKIKQLEAAAAKEPFDSDYQLLLGYQYLGAGELDKAHQPLTEAAGSTANTTTAGKLLELAAKLENEAPENE